MALAELRQVHQHSQQNLATALNVNQPAIAKLEKRTHTSVAIAGRPGSVVVVVVAVVLI